MMVLYLGHRMTTLVSTLFFCYFLGSLPSSAFWNVSFCLYVSLPSSPNYISCRDEDDEAAGLYR